MENNKKLLGIALILVAVQLLLMFMPIVRYETSPFSAPDMVNNYTQLFNSSSDEYSRYSDESENTTMIFIFGALTVYLLIASVVNMVQALAFDLPSAKKMSLLCWASAMLAAVTLVNWVYLKIELEEDVYITLLGFISMAPPIVFYYLTQNLVSDTATPPPAYNPKSEDFFKKTPSTPSNANRYCPHCGDPCTSNICDMCGKPINPTVSNDAGWFCPKCGQKNPEARTTCWKCNYEK